MAQNDAKRQQTYRERLKEVDRTVIRLVVDRTVAQRLRRMARHNVTRQGSVLAKALDALEATAASTAQIPE